MKILQVMREINKRGGIARGVYELSNKLSKDHDIHLLTNRYTAIEGVTAHTYWLPPFPFSLKIGYNSVQTFKYLSKHSADYDIVASHDAESSHCDILHKHSVYKTVLEQQLKTRDLKYKILKRLDPRAAIVLDIENDVVENSKHIIAVSETIKNQLIKEYDISKNKVSVVHNGVNINEFHPNFKHQFRYPIRKKHKIKPTDTVLLFVGFEWERKGLEPLIKSLSQVNRKRVKLLVVGRGDTQKFQDIANKNGVGGKVIFAGTTHNMQQYYGASDLFVFPTHYEPFGLVITEAMAAGLPVITTSVAGAAELVNPLNGLILKHTTPTEIAGNINHILDNDLENEMSIAARETAEEYNWSNQAEKILEIYEKWRK